MQTKASTLSFLWQIVSRTGEVGTDGQPVQRTSFPVNHLRAYNSLKKQVIEKWTEVAVWPEGADEKTLTAETVEWVPNAKDFKAPEGKKHGTDRFKDSDAELTDSEKKLVEFCFRLRDEVPAVDEATLDEFEAVTGVKVGSK